MGASYRRLGSVSIQVLDREKAIARVIDAIGQRSNEIFAFCNMHTFNLANSSPQLTAALEQATVFNDGIGMDIASRILFGAPFPANLNGTDLTPSILGALSSVTTVYLVGSAAGVADKAAQSLSLRFPNLRIVGTQHGFFEDQEGQAIADRVHVAGTDLLLLGMGNPHQEIWAARHAARTGAVVMCVGAFFDFTAGTIPRAPALVRAMRCEWVYRLALEPRRMTKRYIGGAVPFLWSILREKRRGAR